MLRRLLGRIVNWASNYDEPDRFEVVSSRQDQSNNVLTHTRPTLNLTMYVGIGGKVLEFYSYNDRDERTSKVYVVADNDDFTEQLTRILSLELMRF
jgi:hypothetical protein